VFLYEVLSQPYVPLQSAWHRTKNAAVWAAKGIVDNGTAGEAHVAVYKTEFLKLGKRDLALRLLTLEPAIRRRTKVWDEADYRGRRASRAVALAGPPVEEGEESLASVPGLEAEDDEDDELLEDDEAEEAEEPEEADPYQ